MDNICKNCKYWKRDENSDDGACNILVANPKENIKIRIKGASKVYVEILFGQDFGCKHFTVKDGAEG
jgi:hypothetical protein